jgi:hypothetical protein
MKLDVRVFQSVQMRSVVNVGYVDQRTTVSLRGRENGELSFRAAVPETRDAVEDL